eukprot:GAHX01000387.1.p1 GENE.GAHX01000387.1~~GAHX01000387.1.p1  ORF type:complete len:607 (-),score=141.21 GAHX01000387.1:15-1799(-)
MEMQLTSNIIPQIPTSSAKAPFILQVLRLKKVVGDTAENDVKKDVFVASLSDGTNYLNTVLSKEYNNLVFTKDIRQFSILQIEEYTILPTGSKTLIQKLTILSTGSNMSVIGKPTAYTPNEKAQSFSPNSQPVGRTPSRSNNERLTQPINSLTQFLDRWCIKVRVTRKGEVRHWENPRGKGKLFNFDVLDDHGGEINVVVFTKEVDKFFDKIQVGKYFFISNGTVKPITKSFTGIKNPYQIVTGDRTEIEEVSGGVPNISLYKFNFVKSIDDLIYMSKDDILDICGVVLNIGEPNTIQTKKGSSLSRLNITIGDSSMRSVEITLWGSEADEIYERPLKEGDVICIKGARYNVYQEFKRLSTMFGSVTLVNPKSEDLSVKNNEQISEVKSWYDKVDKGGLTLSSISANGTTTTHKYYTRLAEEIDLNMLGMGEKPEFFFMNGIVEKPLASHEKPPYYESCTKSGCKKKVVQDANGYMFCNACQSSTPMSKPRYILSFSIGDFSGNKIVMGFEDTGKYLFNCEADSFKDLMERGDVNGFKELLGRAIWKEVNMRCVAKAEEYNGENRVKISVLQISDIDYVKEGNDLLERLNKVLY